MKKTQVCACGLYNFQTFTISTPIGIIEGTCCDQGLHTLLQTGTSADEDFKPDHAIPVEILSAEKSSSFKVVKECEKWMQLYFDNPKLCKPATLPRICAFSSNTAFCGKVLRTLAGQVGPGDTVSYAQLAGLAGNPAAARAAGSAMKSNRLMIIVPCHRVIKSDGSLGLYAGGTRNHVKAWLLEHERSATSL